MKLKLTYNPDKELVTFGTPGDDKYKRLAVIRLLNDSKSKLYKFAEDLWIDKQLYSIAIYYDIDTGSIETMVDFNVLNYEEEDDD